MTDIEKALVIYDGNNDMPYCDLVWQALKEKKERDERNILTKEYLEQFVEMMKDWPASEISKYGKLYIPEDQTK